MEVDLIAESVKFMILGMLIVLIFLTLLVYLIKLQAWVIDRFFPDPPEAPVQGLGIPPTEEEEERRRTAAIVAAVLEYRKQRSGRRG